MRHDPNNFWEQLERLEKLIRASEMKAGLILSFQSIVLGLFFDRLDDLQVTFGKDIVFIVIVSLWLICASISIYFSVKCFMPRLELKFDKNIFFFRDAAQSYGGIDEFTKELLKVYLNEEELFKQLGEQIYIESKIIDEKFKNVQKSIKFLAFSFIFVVLLLVLWLLKL
jgi:hypothetical protein